MHAPRELAFIGLPNLVVNGICNYAQQALLVVHALADPTPLSPTPELLAQEVALDDPARTRHNIPQPGGGPAYQDVLVTLIQDHARHAILPRGTPFTEPWRAFASRERARLRRAWMKLESLRIFVRY